MTKRIGILTSGGDSPGMNAAIRAATLVGLARDCEMFGIRRGYRGLIAGDIEPLDANAVASIQRHGGTLLGTARCPEFLEREARDVARGVLAERGIEAVIVIGGNGSLAGARLLADPAEAGENAPQVVGVPASIDNDIALTGMCIGVDTAMNTIVDACDNIADTAGAHDRTFIVEVMGRDSGYLAMTAAVAVGADGVLFPEAKQTEQELVESVVKTVCRARVRTGRSRRVLIIKAEGVAVSTERLKEQVDARLKSELADSDVETRVTVLGHVVRGGRPSAADRILAGRLGRVAVRALIEGKTGMMVGWVPPGKLPTTVDAPSDHDPHCCLVDLTAVLRETERTHAGENPLIHWRTHVFSELEDVMRL